MSRDEFSYIKVDLVEVAVGMEHDVHVVQTSDLEQISIDFSEKLQIGSGTFRWPEWCQFSTLSSTGKRMKLQTSEVLEQLDLAQCALCQNLLAEDIGDLLDGHALVCLVVYGGAVAQINVSPESSQL